MEVLVLIAAGGQPPRSIHLTGTPSETNQDRGFSFTA